MNKKKICRFPWAYKVVDGEMMFPRRGLFLFEQGWMINLYVTGFFKSKCMDWRTGKPIQSRKVYFISIRSFRPYRITCTTGVMAEDTGRAC